MVYLIAGVLLGAAVAVLTLPWSRRDPADFSTVELGYAWRGPRGAVIGALRVLMDEDRRRWRQDGMVRPDKRLPRDVDPLVRAVHAGLDHPRGPSALLELRKVEDELPPIAERVLGARLRVGPARRAIGSFVALVAVMMPVVALAHSVGDVVTGIAVSVGTVLVASRLVALRGITIRGARTLAAVPRRGGTRRRGARRGGRLAAASFSVLTGAGWETPAGFGAVGGDSGGDGGGGDSGGGY